MLQYHFSIPQETLDLGAHCASVCPNACVFYLQGALGSGKTTFTQGFLHELGGFTSVKSPTYTLIELYTTATKRALHLDLYRLTHSQDVEMLGLADYTLIPSIWLIEWPERAQKSTKIQLLPKPDIMIEFQLLPTVHQLQLQPFSETGLQILQTLKQ